jgi:regulator of sigma E protease
VAKYFGVKVLKFSLGFGYRLVGRQVGETEYLISTVPLGGYVKLLGEDPDEEDSIPEDEKYRAFNHQPVLKRIAIVVAGPFFNLILAFFLFSGLFFFSGQQLLSPEIGQVREGSPAHKAGLMKGDIIQMAGGKPIRAWDDLRNLIRKHGPDPLMITVRRGNDILSFNVVPEEAIVRNIFGEKERSYLIGIVASGKTVKIEMGMGEAILQAFLKTVNLIWLTCVTIVKLFQGVVSIKTLGGPIMIGQMTGELAKQSFAYIVPLLAVISINLGILNLLPVPILDGGLIIFLLIELISGKPLSIKKREVAQKIGMVILGVLIVIVTFNDLSRIEFFRKIFQSLFG